MRDHRIHNTVRPAVATITKFSQDALPAPAPAPAPAPRPYRRARAEPAVESVIPDRTAWSIALDLAGGDARRLEVITPTNVRVHNQPWR